MLILEDSNSGLAQMLAANLFVDLPTRLKGSCPELASEDLVVDCDFRSSNYIPHYRAKISFTHSIRDLISQRIHVLV